MLKKNIKKIPKPWGFEVLLEKNKIYMLKKLFMKQNHRCSLQYHRKKIETIFILSGELEISYGKLKNKLTKKKFFKNDIITIKPKMIHRMRAIKNCYYLEASTPQLKDVVRIEDDYKRL